MGISLFPLPVLMFRSKCSLSNSIPFSVDQSQKSPLASAEHSELATAPAHPCFHSQAPMGRQAPTGLPLASPTFEKMKCQKEDEKWSITGALQHWGCSELDWLPEHPCTAASRVQRVSHQSHAVILCQLQWTQGWVFRDGCSSGCRLPQQRLLWKTLQWQNFQPYSCVRHCLPESPWCMVSQARLAPRGQAAAAAAGDWLCWAQLFQAFCSFSCWIWCEKMQEDSKVRFGGA